MNGSDDQANDPSLRGNENVVVDLDLNVIVDVNEERCWRGHEVAPEDCFVGSSSMASSQ